MTNANTKILDAVTSRALDLQRLTAGQRRDARRFLSTLEAELAAQVARFDPTGPVRTATQQARLDKLITQVRATIKTAYRDESKRLVGELRELADIEAKFAATSVNKIVGVELITSEMTRAQLSAIVADVLIEGAPVSEWLSRQAGEQNGEVVKGFMEISKRNADTLVRSATQAVSQKSRQATYEENDSLIKSVQWVSTIDLRTTPECSTRDGLTYTVEGHEPIGHSLPWGGGPGNFHWGCRSSSAPVLKTFRELGINVDDVPPSTRASLDGQIAQDTTFEGWLSRQSVAHQNDNLGVGRAALWRDGKIGFRDLVDGNGRELTLKELRARI